MSYATCSAPQSLTYPGVNIYENAAEVLLEVELPGRKREEISVEMTERTLKISAPEAVTAREGFEAVARERRRGAFERSFRLGADLQAEKIQARFENGLLLLSIAKHEKAQPRKVEIA
jgi:HSP20 family molecular chaperone IbpA